MKAYYRSCKLIIFNEGMRRKSLIFRVNKVESLSSAVAAIIASGSLILTDFRSSIVRWMIASDRCTTSISLKNDSSSKDA